MDLLCKGPSASGRAAGGIGLAPAGAEGRNALRPTVAIARFAPMRVRQAWDFDRVLGDRARRLSIERCDQDRHRIDALRAALVAFQPGDTAVRLQIPFPNCRGAIEWNGQRSLRACPALLEAIKPLQVVGDVRVEVAAAHRSDGSSYGQ